MKNILFLVCVAIIIPPANVTAEVKSVDTSHTYRMGDNDSRNDARHICFIEAKRKVIEKAGTYVEGISKIKNFQLTKDEITSFSAALLSIETIEEKWHDMTVTLKVRALVASSYIEKQLIKIHGDTSLQNNIKSQQAKIDKLEKSIAILQEKLVSVDAVKAASLRKDRNIVFKQIDELAAKKIEIIERIEKRSRDAKKYVTKGMTKYDVKSLLGQPDGIDFNILRGENWYYGNTYVQFNAAFIVVDIMDPKIWTTQ